MLAEAGPHQTGFHRNSPLRERDRSRHAGAGGDDDDEDRVTDEHGRILRDNAYGTIDDDVWRRDFTANALYYNIADFSIWDYAGGVEDIAARRLKLIGDPATRYREDPVRMLRAARFEAKLGFSLDGETGTAIRDAARVARQRAAGAAVRRNAQAVPHGPRRDEPRGAAASRSAGRAAADGGELSRAPSRTAPSSRLVRQGLVNTDQRVAAGKPVTPTFLFALLLYGPIAEIIEKQPQEKWHDIGTIVDAVDRAARGAQGRISIPKRFSLGVREMFAAQPRLEQPRGRRALRMLEQPRFRAGFDLLLLRADMGLASRELADWWTKRPGSLADGSRPHGRRAGAAATSGRRRWRCGAAPRTAPPSPRARPRTRGP